jgi:hypothetical protein
MRNHISQDIIKKEISPNQNFCGYCGCVGCSIQLVLSSRIGSKKIFEPSSNLMYYTKFSMGPASKST